MQNKKSAEQVLSRRLRPIYDCIDVGQYKKAILEVDKVLKKHPNTHTAKALKALALIRTERAAEAMPILNSLEKTITEDEEYNENTMQALCHCYKELNNPQQIVALYSSVAKRFPTNDKLIRELFFAHVRTRNYRQQQQVAMQLYKEANLVQYYCWSVLSVLMQGQDNPRLGSTMFFPLAEKMLAKLTVEELYQMQGGLDLQLLVLESNGKFGQAIELLVSSPKYAEENYSEEQVKQMLDRFYKCQGDAHAWLARNQRAVEIDPNEWSNWTNLAESAIAIMKDRPPEECAGIAQRTAQHWHNTFDHFCAGDPSNLPANCRGLLLGRLLLLQKFLDANVQSSLLGSPLSACEELISAVGHKPFGFADLKPFTNLLDANDAQQLLDLVDQRRRQFKQLDDSIWLTILWEQCHFHFHHPATLSDAQLREAVHRLVAHLVGGQEEINDENGNSGKDMDGVSRRPNGMQATALVQLMAQYVWEQYTRKEPGEEAPLNMLLALIAFMETIWADFEDCTASVPILLCRLYGIFGDIDRIKNLEREVQLKFLQKDSLAFLRFFVPGNFGKFKCANIYYTSLGSMYDVNEREANECLVGAYKNAAFHQIPKLVDFASRSANSIFSVGADILSRCISGCFAVGAEMAAGTLAGDGQSIDWDSVADNRDFSVLPIISSELLVAQMREHSFKEMKLYFKLKHSLITAIGHVGTGQLAQSVLQFQQTLEECRKEFPVDTSKSQECRLESFTNLRLDSLVNPDNFLFDLPQSVLSLALELAELRAKNPAEDMNNAAKKKACLAAVTFSPLLQKLADYYRVPDVATLEGRICALQRVSSALELIALSQIGHRLVEKMVAANASSSSSRPNSPAINNNGDIQQQQKQQVRRKTKNGERDKDNDKKAEKPQSQQMQKGVVVDLFAQSLLSMRAFLSEHFGSQNASIKGANINQQYGADQIFPESARQSIVRMQECVIASINGAHSVDELQEAIGHLLANYSSVRQ